MSRAAVAGRCGVTSVIWHATTTLDGFLSGPDGDMSWMDAAAAPNPTGWALVPRIGAIVAGRRTHDLGLAAGDGGGPYGGRWRGPIVVPTSRPADVSPHPDVCFVSGVAEAVRRAVGLAAGRDVAVLGGAVGTVALREGLVDELLVHLVPVLLGRGIRLYPAGGEQRFEVLETSGAGELTTLRLRPLAR
jgi:dihydrofolate reductase